MPPEALPTSSLPRVAVLSDKFLKGADSLEAPEADPRIQMLEVVNFEQAFYTPWPSDAHFVCYRPSDNIEQVYPRLNKPFLPRIRIAGGDVLMTMFGFDYDTPGHNLWTKDGWETWLDQLADLAFTWPLAADWSLLYRTRMGARLVYILDKPLPADVAEGKHRYMVRGFRDRGMQMDRLSDWTRVFRLPFVVRSSKPTWDDEWPPEIEFQQGKTLDAASLPSVNPTKEDREYADLQTYDDPIPEYTAAISLCWKDAVIEGQMTDWYKRAKSQLRGRDCYPCLFEHQPLASQGERNTKIHQYVGQAVGVLVDHNVAGTTMEHVFGLFLPAIQNLEDDANKSWDSVLWDAIKRLWAKQEAKQKAVEQKAVIKAEEELTALQNVVKGFREWCRHPELHRTDNDNKNAIEWAARRFIVSVGTVYYVMQTNGYYFPAPLLSHQIIPFIECSGMGQVIATEEMTDMGPRPVTVTDLLKDHGTIAHDITVTAEQYPGARVINMDQPEATVIQPMFARRTDLEPTFNEHVDQWLRHFFGQYYDLGLRWIAWALAFDEGAIAALSIKAQGGAGKKMLVQGLAECMKVPKVADHNDLMSDYQYGLLKSPFLLVNEGFPRDSKHGGPFHQFRRFVGGDSVRGNRKNLHPVEILCPYRVLFTANNDNIVETLVGRANLSSEDRDALAIRLIHIDIGDTATNWLRQNGGIKLTGAKGSRWIAPDAGGESNFVLARHFLWLYEHRHELGPTGSRFLVEGNASSDILFKLRTQGGSAPLVIETIVAMLNAHQLPKDIAIDNNRLYVLSQGIVEYFRTHLSQKIRESLTANMVTAALRGLTLHEMHAEPFILESRESVGRRRWQELDPEALILACEKSGIVCKNLEKLVESRRLQDRSRHLGATQVKGKPNEPVSPLRLRGIPRTS